MVKVSSNQFTFRSSIFYLTHYTRERKLEHKLSHSTGL